MAYSQAACSTFVDLEVAELEVLLEWVKKADPRGIQLRVYLDSAMEDDRSVFRVMVHNYKDEVNIDTL